MTIPAHRLTARNAYRQVSEVSAFAANHVYPLDTRVYGITETSGGLVTHTPALASLACTVTSASGSRALLRSYCRPRAAAGRARSTIIVGHATVLVASQIKRWGLFDDNNGYYFELDGETLYVTRRTDASGSVVDTANRVANAQWDAPDSINPLVTQVWEIREAWPNGDIQFFVNGNLVHTLSTAGAIVGPSTRHARLPVSVETINSASASAGAFLSMAAAVEVEEMPRAVRSFGAHVTDASVDATGEALLSIRCKTTVSSIPVYGELVPDELSIVSSSDCRVQIIAGGTVADGTWASHHADSLAESNVTNDAIPAGVVVAEYVCTGTLSLYLGETIEAVRLLGSTQDPLTIVAKSLTGAAITVRAALTWKEIR